MSKRLNAKNVRVGEGSKFDVLLAPVITEKSTRGAEHNQITFKVRLDATKPEIKVAVEKLFKVKVTGVNTVRQNGKIKRFRGTIGKRDDFKKAVVTLAEGQTIDITSGL